MSKINIVEVLSEEELLQQLAYKEQTADKLKTQAFGVDIDAMLEPVTNDTNETETNGTVTNETVTNDTPDLDPYLLPSEAANMLGVTRKTIREWYNKGIIKGIVTGGGNHLRVPTSEVYRLKSLRYTPPTVIPADAYLGFEDE